MKWAHDITFLSSPSIGRADPGLLRASGRAGGSTAHPVGVGHLRAVHPQPASLRVSGGQPAIVA